MRSILLVTLLAWTAVAQAQDDRAAAKRAYEDALQLYWAGDYRGAAEGLRKAYELAPLPAILFNLGVTYAKLGESSAAKATLKEYLAKAPDAPNRAEAEQILESLDAAVKSDDQENPLVARQERQVTAPPPRKHVEESDEPDQPRLRIWKWATAGVAVSTAIVGTMLLTRASDQGDVLRASSTSVDGLPSMRYSASLRAIEDGYATNRLWGTISLVGCAAATATSITLFVLDARDEADDRRARIAPMAGPGFAGIGASGAF